MPSESSDTVKVLSLNREAILRGLRQAARELARADGNVRDVRLFGSLARGNYGPRSDADLLILLERSDSRIFDRYVTYAPAFDGIAVDCDLFCYTREELDRIPLARSAMRESISLLE